MSNLLKDKATLLFIFLGGFFIANALIAEFLGVKIFSVEKSLGFQPLNFTLFGEKGLSFNMTAGVLLWPFVFVMTDVINEYFGERGVRLLSLLTAGFIAYAFLMFALCIQLAPADFWVTSHIPLSASPEVQAAIRQKVGDYDYAYRLVFGQGLWIIVGSLTAFLLGQLIDVFIFHHIKRITGENMLWLRSTGSTLISQFVDSFVVLFIAFYLGAGWSLKMVIVVGFVAYIYKFLVALLMTPVIYGVHYAIENYLGKDLAQRLKEKAAQD